MAKSTKYLKCAASAAITVQVQTLRNRLLADTDGRYLSSKVGNLCCTGQWVIKCCGKG